MASQQRHGEGTAGQSWHANISIDLLYRVATRSFLHWFIAWMIPLSLVALGRPAGDTAVLAGSAYALIVDLVWAYSVLDDRIAFGAGRKVVPSEEVVVITGGANGLGLILAQMLGLHGFSVAVLDVEAPDVGDVRGVTFYRCDVGDTAQLARTAQSIEHDLGPVTVLVNNAGVVRPRSMFDITEGELDHSYRVNTLSHFHSVRIFVPGMLKRGHGSIVTVSSVMGKLGCAELSAYTSTKAALLSMHASLRADLAQLGRTEPAAANIKTVLVTPGQLNTRMFSKVRTPSTFLAPVVEPIEVARDITRLLLSGRSGEISVPLYTRLVGILDLLPPGLRDTMRWAAGMDRAMLEASGERSRMAKRS